MNRTGLALLIVFAPVILFAGVSLFDSAGQCGLEGAACAIALMASVFAIFPALIVGAGLVFSRDAARAVRIAAAGVLVLYCGFIGYGLLQ